MPRYILDTNAIIYFAGDEPGVSGVLRPLIAGGTDIYIPTVVVTELFSIALTPASRMALEMAISTGTVVPFYEAMAHVAADLRRDYRIEFADATIAATALTMNAILLTRNVRDFKRIPNLSVQAI